MKFPGRFIAAGHNYNDPAHPVPAPYFRRGFTLLQMPCTAKMTICACGFYELFVNGKRVTKGRLAPYIASPDQLAYCDAYELAPHLREGENVLGILLGNGLQNNPGGFGWDFDKAPWRGAVRFALNLVIKNADGCEQKLESDLSFRCASSPIVFDDYRYGEHYDARLEQPGWNERGFDDSGWGKPVFVRAPRGEARLCEADPILEKEGLSPVSVDWQEDGALFDFGINTAGVCHITLDGEPGQQITLYHAELLKDGRLDRSSILFPQYEDGDLFQKDVYICKGKRESYTPCFTYHGFQYVLVKGLLKQQRDTFSILAVPRYSALAERGGFTCSDETLNRLQQMTRQSTLTNFHYFPTDCPQREKNGWTADAALSAEHTLLNLCAENSYREWMFSVRKAMTDEGALPGIVPTAGWGYAWGNGPAWDSVLTALPYAIYLYTGQLAAARESIHAFLRYLSYLESRINEHGLLEWGLGDWCHVGRKPEDYKAPLQLTDTLMGMDICAKAAMLFEALEKPQHADFAHGLHQRLRSAARAQFICCENMQAIGACQTSQAMALYYGLFEPHETERAFQELLNIIHRDGEHMDVGVLGGRVLFHVLAEHGCTELAVRMIAGPDYPSYGYWVQQGATTLWEAFESETATSHNHHFWGDISHFFIRHLAGIQYHPGGKIVVQPRLVSRLTFAEGFFCAKEGEIRVRWQRQDTGVELTLNVPQGITGSLLCDDGYRFENGGTQRALASGTYLVKQG